MDPNDFVDPQAVLEGLEAIGFMVSLETRASLVTERADVVFPVSLMQERVGTFVNWEGRRRPFDMVLEGPNDMSDLRVLAASPMVWALTWDSVRQPRHAQNSTSWAPGKASAPRPLTIRQASQLSQTAAPFSWRHGGWPSTKAVRSTVSPTFRPRHVKPWHG